MRLSARHALAVKDASVVTRFQPRGYTAQESSEVQPNEFEEDYFHHFTYLPPRIIHSCRFNNLFGVR
jgi:hypothetical protein